MSRPRRTQLRNKFKTNGQFYRVFPNGEVQYLHPKDGVYPEKVNAGRQAVNTNSRRIGANPNPIAVSGRHDLVQHPWRLSLLQLLPLSARLLPGAELPRIYVYRSKLIGASFTTLM